MKIYAVCLMAIAALLLAGCGEPEKKNKGLVLLALMSSGGDFIADMSQSSLETMNDGMSDINTSGETNLSYRIQYPGAWQENPNLQERLLMAEGTLMDAFSARAATVSCPGGGSINVTDLTETWNSGNVSFYVTRSFTNCTGPYGLFRVSGNGLLYWSGMNAAASGAAKLQAGSKLEQAPVDKRFTRVSTGSYVTVEGNGGTLTSGSITGDIAHTVNWTAVGASTRSFQITTDVNRRGYTSGGTLVFNHHVTTPTHLDITVDLSNNTRTVSGTIQVEHVIAGVTVSTTFTNLVIPTGNCIPSSGTAAIAISGHGSGTGTITYNGDGTASYTYSYTNENGRTISGSGIFAVSGCQ